MKFNKNLEIIVNWWFELHLAHTVCYIIYVERGMSNVKYFYNFVKNNEYLLTREL